MATAEDQAIITAGGQNALHAIIGTMFAPGDVICAGRSTYPGLLALARRFGLTVRAIPGDGEGSTPMRSRRRRWRARRRSMPCRPTTTRPPRRSTSNDGCGWRRSSAATV
ncbi:hypothetical protein ACFSTI_08865 [Rhizorhabdus histidinilytica]